MSTERVVVEEIDLDEAIIVKEIECSVLPIYRPRVGDFLKLKKRKLNVADLLLEPSDAMVEAATKANAGGSDEMTLGASDLAKMRRQVFTHVDVLVALLALCSDWTEAHLRQLTGDDMLRAYLAIVPLLGA